MGSTKKKVVIAMSFIFFVISIVTAPIYFAIWVKGAQIFCSDCEKRIINIDDIIDNKNDVSPKKCYLQFNNTDSEFYCNGFVQIGDFYHLVYNSLHEEIKLDLYTIITVGIIAPILTLAFDIIMWIKKEKIVIYKLAANLFFSFVSLIIFLIVSGVFPKVYCLTVDCPNQITLPDLGNQHLSFLWAMLFFQIGVGIVSFAVGLMKKRRDSKKEYNGSDDEDDDKNRHHPYGNLLINEDEGDENWE